MLDAETTNIAVTYATSGWAVLPVWGVNEYGACACGDLHLGSKGLAGKHPITELVPNGYLGASADPELTALRWANHPTANIGVNCTKSGLVVIDIDPRHQGWDTIRGLQAAGVTFPGTAATSTGGGGAHWFYRDPGDRRFRGRLGPGVEVKHNGYVIVPPSLHASGCRYEWSSPPGTAVAELSESLAERLTATTALAVVGDDNEERPEAQRAAGGARVGDRDNALFSYAGYLRGSNRIYADAVEEMRRVWERCEQPPGDEYPWSKALDNLNRVYASYQPGTTLEQQTRAFEPIIQAWTNGDAGPNGNGAGPEPDDETMAEQKRLIAAEAVRQLVLIRGRRLALATDAAETFQTPEDWRLDALLANGVPEPQWTVEGLHEWGSNTSLTAAFKTGKSTMVLNLLRALADGTQFLDAYECRALSGNVAFFNYELSAATLARWLGRMQIRNPRRIFGLNLRNRRLDLSDDTACEWVIGWLRSHEIEVWVTDPLARAYYGSENDNTELKLWTDAVDAIKGAAGVADFWVTLHTGRALAVEGEEHARGATRIDDWVDSRWVMTQQSGNRYFRATGREIESNEAMLHFDPETWRLSLNHLRAVPRWVARDLEGVAAVVETVGRLGATETEPTSISTVRNAMTVGTVDQRTAWINSALADGSVCWRVGIRANAKLLWLPEAT